MFEIKLVFVYTYDFPAVYLCKRSENGANSPLDLGHQDLSGVLECLHAGASQLPDLLSQLGAVLGLAHVYQHVAEERHMAVDLHDELESQAEGKVRIRVIGGNGCLIYAKALLGRAHSTQHTAHILYFNLCTDPSKDRRQPKNIYIHICLPNWLSLPRKILGNSLSR